MTVYYDKRNVIPGGWNPPKHQPAVCVKCNKIVDRDSRYYEKMLMCGECGRKTEERKTP